MHLIKQFNDYSTIPYEENLKPLVLSAAIEVKIKFRNEGGDGGI